MPGGPLIGIAGSSYVVRRPWGELGVHGIPRSYVEHVARAGGRPVVVPPGGGHEVLDALDGLVLAGGGDVDPTLYGGPPGCARDVDRTRDEAEVALVRTAREIGLPTLGVCRGAQVFAVADGGTLVPDLGPDRPHILPNAAHPVTTLPGSACARLLAAHPVVNSLHHQAIGHAGSGWRTTVWADDGVVEAVEWNDLREWPAIGVQWHPELDATGARLFGWLVGQSAHHRAGRCVVRIDASRPPFA